MLSTYYKSAAVIMLALGALAVASRWSAMAAADNAGDKDCCAQKLACCGADKACCQATNKAGCCATGQACCQKDQACCTSTPACCLDGKECCAQAKVCCGAKAEKRAASCCHAESTAAAAPGENL